MNLGAGPGPGRCMSFLSCIVDSLWLKAQHAMALGKKKRITEDAEHKKKVEVRARAPTIEMPGVPMGTWLGPRQVGGARHGAGPTARRAHQTGRPPHIKPRKSQAEN